ncbi:HTH_Tnp_Tc3_2 domain-containing protein [Trichonephila clavipes]|nr:HTH_Tnp_Tc3_2 domain-containing protein [Trichonephila clavipes]
MVSVRVIAVSSCVSDCLIDASCRSDGFYADIAAYRWRHDSSRRLRCFKVQPGSPMMEIRTRYLPIRRVVEYYDCILSYRNIAAGVGRYPKTVSRIWNQWVQDSNTDHRAGSQLPPITSNREDKHVTRMVLMDRAATSSIPSQELASFARQQVSTQTVRRVVQQHRHSVRRPWLRLPLTLHLQSCDQQRTWTHE